MQWLGFKAVLLTLVSVLCIVTMFNAECCQDSVYNLSTTPDSYNVCMVGRQHAVITWYMLLV